MRTHSISSSQNRSSAEAHKGHGVSLPAAQLFKVDNFADESHRISEKGNLMVRDSGKPDYFYATSGAALAPNVLAKTGDGPSSTAKLGINVSFIDDCGEYANRILHGIFGVDRLKEGNVKRIKNANEGSTDVPDDPGKLFSKINPSGVAQPDLGEVYLAISNPDLEQVVNKTQYNFHWATVVGQDGGDVVTAESAPKAGKEWCQMYHHANEGQTFREHYVFTTKMLAESAKIFTATFHKAEKKQEDGGYISD